MAIYWRHYNIEKYFMLKELFEIKSLNVKNRTFFFGMLLMTFGTILYSFEDVINANFAVIRYIIMSLAAYFFLKYIYYSKKRINFLTFSFFLWTLCIIFFSFDDIIKGDYNYILFKKILSGELLLYIIPLISFCGFDLEILKKIFQFSFYLAVLGCLFVPFSSFIYQNVRVGEDSAFGYENLSRIFTASGVILLLTFPYHRKKINLVVIISIIISLVAFLITARRNMIVYYVAVIGMALIILKLSKTIGKQKKALLIFVILLIISILTFVFFEYIDLFSFVISRFETGFESRESIIDEFIYDFNNTPVDWYTGRGIFGSFRTNILILNDALGTRDVIENGYLIQILRGGYIYLGLVILLSISAIYKGLFKSKNLLSKAFAFIIIIYFIDMVGYGVAENHIKFLIIWVGIAVCNTKSFLEMNEHEIAQKIGLK